MKKVLTNSQEETIELASKLGNHLKLGSVILLDGDLGTGKTTFTKGMGKSLGVRQNISSPSFTIMKSYSFNEDNILNHLDLYRLDGIGADFDLEDYIDDVKSITIIEWPFKVSSLLPKEYLLIKITYVNEFTREFEFIPVGKTYEDLIDKI